MSAFHPLQTFRMPVETDYASRREIEKDDDSERFRERLGKLMKHKPVEKRADDAA